MSENKPKFAVSQYTTFPLSFEQDIELYTKLGIDGIEIAEEKLSDDIGKAREQLAMVTDSGLKVTSVQPAVLSLFPHLMDTEDNPQTPEDRLARYRKTIDLFSECFPGQNIPLVTGGGKAPGFNFRLAHRVARKLYPELTDYAADKGVRIMFEPLSPILMNAFTFITSLDEAMQLIADIDRDNFGLNLDIWHLWREPNIAERIAKLDNIIFAVHICDWPKQEPRSFADRVLPGDGLIDLPALLGAIENTGYDSAYCLEIFSEEKFPDSLWRQNPGQIINKGRDGFINAWQNRRKFDNLKR